MVASLVMDEASVWVVVSSNLTRFSFVLISSSFFSRWGWSGGAKVLINLQCRGVLLVWTIVGQGPIALALGAGGGLFGHFFSRLFFLLSFSLSLGDGPI